MDHNLSPNPIIEAEPVTMSFPDAIRELTKGSRITRLSWKPEVSYGILANGTLMIFIHNELHSWIINDGDLEATDWITLDD